MFLFRRITNDADPNQVSVYGEVNSCSNSDWGEGRIAVTNGPNIIHCDILLESSIVLVAIFTLNIIRQSRYSQLYAFPASSAAISWPLLMAHLNHNIAKEVSCAASSCTTPGNDLRHTAKIQAHGLNTYAIERRAIIDLTAGYVGQMLSDQDLIDAVEKLRPYTPNTQQLTTND